MSTVRAVQPRPDRSQTTPVAEPAAAEPPAADHREVLDRGLPCPPDPGAAATTARSLCLVAAAGPGVVVVRPCGVLDMGASLHLGTILTDLVVGHDNLSVTVDLAKVSQVEPTCLDMLSRAAATIERHGGSLAVRGARRDIVDALTTAGMLRLVDGSNTPRCPKPSTRREAFSRSRHPAGSALDDAGTAITRSFPGTNGWSGR